MLTLPAILREAHMGKVPGTRWIGLLAENGLQQDFILSKDEPPCRVSLFGGSPCWWLDRPAALPGPCSLIGIMIDQSQRVRLFQIESSNRINTLQIRSVFNAVSSCPAGGRLKLGDIGLMTRPPSQQILVTVSTSIQSEIIALVKRYEPRVSAIEQTQLKGWVTRHVADFVKQIEQFLQTSYLPDEIDLDRKFQTYNALVKLPIAQRLLQAEAMSVLPFIPGLQQVKGFSIAVNKSIADGVPLIPHIADMLSIPEWAVRALRDAYLLDGMIRVCPPTDPNAVLSLLLLIPILDKNLLPTTADGWDYLCHAYRILPREWITELQRFRFDSLASGRLLPKKMQRWKGRVGLNRQWAIMRDYLDYANHAGDLQFPLPIPGTPFSQLLHQATQWRRNAPAHILTGYYNRQLPHWLQRETAPGLRAGPLRIGHLLFQDLTQDEAAATWPALFNEPLHIMSYTFIELNCALDLVAEGMAMGHCVGSYVHRCVNFKTHIISVTRMGKRVATIELGGSSIGAMDVRQIRGPGNRIVDSDVIAAATFFLAEINAVNCPNL